MSEHTTRWIALCALVVLCSGCARHDARHQVATGAAPGPWDRPGTKLGQEIVGPDGGKMVWVPPGEFQMGSTEGNDDEEPVHRVRITRGFWLGKCEVTNAQYRRYCQATRRLPAWPSWQGDDHPVVWVSWTNVAAYCRYYGLQLPTEAQWEYAARGPQSRKYPWGDKWDTRNCCNNENRGPKGKTFPVGSFPDGASWCGALDMAGNVSEWCQDWVDVDYYARSPVDDPQGPAEAVDNPDFGKVRASRGGGWPDTDNCRSACRNGDPVWARDSHFGFRCIKAPTAATDAPAPPPE